MPIKALHTMSVDETIQLDGMSITGLKATHALTIALYEVFVRRFNVVRFFFGMPPKKKPSAMPLLSNSRRRRDHVPTD